MGKQKARPKSGRNLQEKVFSFVLIMSLVFLILAISYYATAFRPSLYPTPEHQNVKAYLQNREPLITPMTVAEASHLRDVRLVMQGVAIITFVAFIRAVVGVVALRDDKKRLLACFRVAGLAAAGVAGVLGVVGVVSFSTLFEEFHQVFFPQGNWVFPADSTLITLFPVEFFSARFVEIVVVSLVVASFFIVSSYYLEQKRRCP